MTSRITKIAAIVALIVVLPPFILLAFVARFFEHLWHVTRLRVAWPSGKFVLLAYTESRLWAPYIEDELLPQIAEHCVVVNRSRENWKRQFRAECGALSFWGGSYSYNPIAVVLRPWGRVRLFRLYEPFKELKHGQASSLAPTVSDLVRCVREIAKGRT